MVGVTTGSRVTDGESVEPARAQFNDLYGRMPEIVRQGTKPDHSGPIVAIIDRTWTKLPNGLLDLVSTESAKQNWVTMNTSAMDRLLEIGFEFCGEWMLDEDELTVELQRYGSAANVLYAFASGDELLYIGRSARSLQLRMDGYQLGGPPRSFRARNRERIIAMLMIDQPVDVFAMPDPGNLHYGTFRVNLAAGLQHSLIEALHPPWNKMHPKEPAVKRPSRSSRMKKRRTHLVEDDSNSYTDLTTDRPSYRFLVGYHYIDKGFFNVPQRYARLFGDDQQKIRIMCGRERLTIHGHIDRSANTNAAPRIVGGRKLKRWFQDNSGINNPVDIDILAPNAVWIRNPGTRF